jgi:ABC-type oligopeptide transport system substrate-binding subunit
MKKLVIGIVGVSAILFAALSSVSYASDAALRSSESSTKAQPLGCAAYTATNAALPVVASSSPQTQGLKAKLLSLIASLLKSGSPIAGVVIPDRPLIDPNPPSKIPPVETPPGIRLYDKIRLDDGWDEKK